MIDMSDRRVLRAGRVALRVGLELALRALLDS